MRQTVNNMKHEFIAAVPIDWKNSLIQTVNKI